ncbi:MAG: cation:proton antiporter [Bdellovibrio sp.]|jgi:Kef-type K+ transport system membrane component KefB
MLSIQEELTSNMTAPLPLLLFQILVILIFSRLCGIVLRKLGQPQVIGEMIAGILLGRSVFAFLWPDGFDALFPTSSMTALYFLSQIGLILFMFVIGLDLKLEDLKKRAPAAILVSHVSIVIPFLLGALAALFLYQNLGPSNSSFASFALFMGISMSITAFPVLARIIQEKNLTHTPLGTMALTCAAIDDVTAWCILAAVLGIVRAGSVASAAGMIALALLYVVLMFKLVRPQLAKLLAPAVGGDQTTRGALALIFCTLLGSALVSEIIGIHALFGAFLAGVIMPRSPVFQMGLAEKIEDLSTVVLLPLFFAYTGIRTQIGLLDDREAWLITLGLIALATVGKMVSSALAARWSGMTWNQSWALGSLMNTRGLMELIVLNIGYDLGLLTPKIFAMMVIMAIVTTMMTGPLVNLFLRKRTIRY